ncbi:MAG: DsrE/DsrF/DrsH-like family protein [Christensenellales bacterium]|jgi:NADPH-dependent 2,4-dienoyl-CoA reductase/sulfur reductase-like enzyme/peroxiredoxin family protein/rhodanese-related sulfurtransferase/TusA-related sulfurtransferase
MKILIVGGVAGGASAATRLRRLDEDAEIILFEKGAYISYANCGLPYYIGGVIRDRERLTVTQPDTLRRRFAIDVRTMSEVVSIDREARTVTVRNHGDGSEYEESYDKLILSPGAEPRRPDLPGIDLEGIFTLRTVPDTFAIDEFIRKNRPTSAVVVGAGFIGVEMAENLKERGLSVSMVEYSDHAVASLDIEMAAILHEHMLEKGVSLYVNAGVEAFEKKQRLGVLLNTGQTLETDLVILSIGVAPENRLAVEAGLTIGDRGGIWVDETYATSDPDIFAVGDAIEVLGLVDGEKGLVPLAGIANRQGRKVAENVLGRRQEATGVQGSAVLKVFDMTAASTGLNEKQLRQLGRPYHKTYVHPSSHADYYPGASQMSLKLLFDEGGRILGAQAVGYEGIEKRIDVLATALRLGATVYDLQELELCYAPPYSSAKDPVNMAGFTAVNILSGAMRPFYYEQVDGLDLGEITLLDVRTPQEAELGTLEGAVNIPVDDLRDRMGELPKEKPVYVFCQVGLRGYVAARMLMLRGYDALNLSGGYKTYSMAKGGERMFERAKIGGSGEGRTLAGEGQTLADVIELDACGLMCPGPIMKLAEGMGPLKAGARLAVRASDPAFVSDATVWAQRTGNTVVDVRRDKNVSTVTLEKGDKEQRLIAAGGNEKTMVLFSGDLDKALAAFIIANGAAAMGRQVTLFFTFWGLNILRRGDKVKVEKSLIERIFGWMMPRGSKKLGLSRMNMWGMGAKMIRSVMQSKNVESLEGLIRSAMQSGVRVMACQMSMDVMGIREEELIDGVELAGVATFLGRAELSDTNLFI